MNRVDVPVLVVGSGPTGLTTALFLARHGIETLVITRARGVADTPRAHITNQRTMEIMRDAGLEAACLAQATPRALMSHNTWVTSLAGVELGRLLGWGGDPARAADNLAASPCEHCDLPQHLFEPILLEEAKRLGARVRFAHELVDFSQDHAGATARVLERDTGSEYEIRAQYMVGADGGRSRVAEQLGLPFSGAMGLGTSVNVLFEADLSKYVAHRPGSLYFVCQPGRAGWSGIGVMRMVRPWHEWVAQFVGLAAGDQEVDLPEADARAIVHSMIGDDTIPIRIRMTNRWLVNRAIAERYAVGRVFCAGDAVHRHPPSNGLGSNTCVADAYNLAWKLALVIKGLAGPRLLETFETERQPVGAQVVDRAYRSMEDNRVMMAELGLVPKLSPAEREAVLTLIKSATPEGEERRRRWREAIRSKQYTVSAHGVELNQIYRNGALIAEEDALVFERDREIYYLATTHPGARLPHCWLEYEGKRVSALDLCGRERFTLLTGIGGGGWREAARAVQRTLGIDIVVREIGFGLPVRDAYDDWARLSGVADSGAVLVRPDMHVGWRCARVPTDPTGVLDAVMRHLLDRPSA